MIKNRYILMATVMLWILVFSVTSVYGAVNVSAEAAVLIDGTTGKILYGKNHTEARPPASTTKVLTAIMAIESGDLEEVATVSKRAALTGEASIHLVAGERINLENLLYGALLKSGNDACVAIAEHVAPSVEEFVGRMNLKASLLGCTTTNFMNTNGLPHPDHHSSALDLAIITRYALNNPVFTQMVATPKFTIEWEESNRKKTLKNTNRLLASYPGAIGVKTGTTNKAGQCLIASAERDGQRLIAVVLKSRNRFGDATRLLDYGFENFQNQEVIKKNQQLKLDEKSKLIFRAQDGLVITVPRGQSLEITCQADFDPRNLAISYSQDEIVGNLIVYNHGQEVGRLPIMVEGKKKIEKDYYSKGTIWDNIRDRLNFVP